MPIEIREIVIRTVVGGGVGGPAPGDGPAPDGAVPAAPVDMDALVQECVRQVMLALARERER